MLLRFRCCPVVSGRQRCRRLFSGFGTGSILGTSTMSGSLIKDLQEDLKQENERRSCGIGDTLLNYVNRAELSHMECPEADAKFMATLEAKVDDLFSRIPLPEDPMRAALSLTDDEMKEEAAAELMKEAVREMYWRKLDAKKAEELRLKRSQEKLTKQGMQDYFAEMKETETMRQRFSETVLGTTATSSSTRGEGVGEVAARRDGAASMAVSADASPDELRAELAAMKAKMAELEKLLRDQQE